MRTVTCLFLLAPALAYVVTDGAQAQSASRTFSRCSCGFIHSGSCSHGLRINEPGPSPDSTTLDFLPPIAGSGGGDSGSSSTPVAEFRIGDRWNRTATDGFNTGARGTPVTLTWGLVPDGTNINFGSVSNRPSQLISFLDNNIGTLQDRQTTNIQQKSWFPAVQSAYDRWSEISGIEFVFEPNDDRITVPNAPGILGVRPDFRQAGASIDGQSGSNTLAFNAFPDNSDGVIDTDNVNFFSDPTNNFRALRNVLMHEIGHGLGFNHLESNNSRQLMEPFINTSFDGPQIDDILAAQRNYGDALEKNGGNNARATATIPGDIAQFGAWAIGVDGDISSPNTIITPDQTDFVSIDDRSDLDFYRFTPQAAGLLDFRIAPVGPTYNEGPQNGTQTPLNTRALGRLVVAVLDSNGQQIAIESVRFAGETINLSNIPVEQGETYFARVGSVTSNIQLYRLDAALNPTPNEGIEFDLVDLGLTDRATFTTTEEGIELSLTAVGSRALLRFDEEGLGVVSNNDAGRPEDERLGIDGRRRVGEQLLLSFDEDVTLENLAIGGFSTDGTESLLLSLIEGENPFADLTGYDGNYEVNDTSLTFESPEWQSEDVNVAFGVAGQSPLVIRAGTVLSLTSNIPSGGGFFLRSVTASVVPEPASWMLVGLGWAAVSARRNRSRRMAA